MSHSRSILCWICSLVVAALTTGPYLHAEDASSTVAHKDTMVPVKGVGPTGTLKVQDPDPYKDLHVPAPETPTDGRNTYDPTKYSLNQSSSLANKSFSSESSMLSKKGSDFVHDQPAFASKTFGQTNQVDPHTMNTKFTTTTSNDATHNDSQFSKSFATPTSSMGKSQSTAFSTTSRDQDHTASLGDKTSKTFASNLNKQYLGPGAQNVPDGLVKENVVIEHVGDIPNRPLTIDEVRGLINHGFKPDLSNSPDVPISRALNDPDYKPEASPEVPDNTAPHTPMSTDDDKNDPVPPPGTMSQPPPENSVPLPQH